MNSTSKPANGKLSIKRQEKILEYSQQGMSVLEIARKLKISRQAVYRRIANPDSVGKKGRKPIADIPEKMKKLLDQHKQFSTSWFNEQWAKHGMPTHRRNTIYQWLRRNGYRCVGKSKNESHKKGRAEFIWSATHS